MLLIVATLAVVGCAARGDTERLLVDGRLAGRSLASGTPDQPIVLHHQKLTELTLDVTNVSDEPVTVAHVRLEGELLDLIFLTYDTGIHETIPPGESRLISFPIDFFDLDGQVHGYLRAKLRLYDPDRVPLASRSLVVDGRGSPWATTSTFNLVLLTVALASFGWNLYRLAQRRLPAHRFARGLRFLHSGTAMGLTLAAAASTLRIWPLASVGWLLVVTIVSLFGFALGYLSPGADTDDENREIIDLDELMADVVVGPPAGPAMDPGRHESELAGPRPDTTA